VSLSVDKDPLVTLPPCVVVLFTYCVIICTLLVILFLITLPVHLSLSLSFIFVFKRFISGTILVSMVTLASISQLNKDIFTLSLSASCLLVLFRCITIKQAFEAVKGRVLLAIFATYGLGAALGNTGVASLFADLLIYIGNLIGPIGLLTMIFLSVSCLSCVVSNQATVILMWPIVSVIDIHGLHIGQFAVILMMAASTSFATPIGYQTNLMVYEPGGYDFKDFARMGIPLTLILAPFASVLTFYLV
jgi:di/tricarboxylate transporter